MRRKGKKIFATEKVKGMEPGALVYKGDMKPDFTNVGCYFIKKNTLEFKSNILTKSDFPSVSKDYIVWIRFSGLENLELIRDMGEVYGIASLTLEDILDTSHSSKFEYGDDYEFIILKKLIYDATIDSIDTKQLSLILRTGVLITFEETPTEDLDIILSRVAKHPDIFYGKGAPYLTYAIIDTIIDDYLGVLDKIQFDIEDLEDVMMSTKGPLDTDDLFIIKRKLNSFYRNTRLTAEIVDKLMKSLTFNKEKKISVGHFKDLTDHALKLNDIVSTCRDTLNAIYDENFARMQLQTSYFINVLTVVNVLLWPFIIVSGIFGMNFDSIPLSSHKYGFFMSIGLMGVLSGALLLYFKKKNFF